MTEPTLDDLLEDELMTPVMRSAGLDAETLRRRLGETARRLDRREAERAASAKWRDVHRALCC